MLNDINKFTKSPGKNALFYLLLSALLMTCSGAKKSHVTQVKQKSKPKQEHTTVTPPKDPNKEKIDKIIETARSYVGTKYKYGGTTRGGMDCSGLMLISFKSGGIELPRTSSAQSTAGKAVKLTELKRGDLVFFTDKKGNTKITHVGLVTEVKGQTVMFIHASTHLGVVETDLFSDYYKPLILKAVRVF